MARDEVIWGLEMSYTYSNVDENNTLVPQQLVLDAIVLLKKQEPVIVKCTTKRTLVDDTYEVIYRDENFYDCPVCGQRLARWNKDTQIKYCWTCGQAVKWE